MGIVAGSQRARAVTGELRDIAACDELPTEADAAAFLPPVGRAWARYVSDAQLWLFFRFDEATVYAVAVGSQRPHFVPEADDPDEAG